MSRILNGLAFAKNEDQFTTPIRFDVPPSKRSGGSEPATKPSGIASIYGPAKQAK